MSSSPLALLFAQVTNTAASATAGTDSSGTQLVANPQQPWWTGMLLPVAIIAMLYFAVFRPQMQASKLKAETIKSAKTGDKIVTSSGIHGVITNVKDSTVIVRVADNVKLEIEKSHIEKITRDAEAEKPVAAKAS